jgi:hypothetical protein
MSNFGGPIWSPVPCRSEIVTSNNWDKGRDKVDERGWCVREKRLSWVGDELEESMVIVDYLKTGIPDWRGARRSPLGTLDVQVKIVAPGNFGHRLLQEISIDIRGEEGIVNR